MCSFMSRGRACIGNGSSRCIMPRCEKIPDLPRSRVASYKIMIKPPLVVERALWKRVTITSGRHDYYTEWKRYAHWLTDRRGSTETFPPDFGSENQSPGAEPWQFIFTASTAAAAAIAESCWKGAMLIITLCEVAPRKVRSKRPPFSTSLFIHTRTRHNTVVWSSFSCFN